MTQASISPRDRAPEPAAPPSTMPAAPAPQTAPRAVAPHPPISAPKRSGGGRRFFLLVVLPLAALALGLMWWLAGGRYISTDNAYVGADKALITPYITGPIVAVHVVEGQKVNVGDPLFDIDPAPLPHRARRRRRPPRRGEGRVRQSTVVVFEQPGADHDGRGGRPTATGGLRSQAGAHDDARRHARRVRQRRGGAGSGQANPRIRPPAAGDRQGEARRRPGQLDRDLPRLYAGQGAGRGRRAQPQLRERQGADRRRRHAGLADRARPRRAGRTARVRDRRRHRPLGRRQSRRNPI